MGSSSNYGDVCCLVQQLVVYHWVIPNLIGQEMKQVGFNERYTGYFFGLQNNLCHIMLWWGFVTCDEQTPWSFWMILPDEHETNWWISMDFRIFSWIKVRAVGHKNWSIIFYHALTILSFHPWSRIHDRLWFFFERIRRVFDSGRRSRARRMATTNWGHPALGDAIHYSRSLGLAQMKSLAVIHRWALNGDVMSTPD